MAAKLTRLTHKIAVQLHLVAGICIICSSRSRWSVRKFLDTLSYVLIVPIFRHVRKFYTMKCSHKTDELEIQINK
jgi:hypothetical protein